jgi:TRAP-type C4-dicarboxylate transport system permease small subunit
VNPLLDAWRRSTALAAALAVAGFAAIAITWVGVSATLSIPTQVAFAVSGGIGGFALVGAGIALLEVQRRRYAAAEERRDLGVLAAELSDVAEILARRRVATPVPREPRRRVLRGR